MGRARLWGRRKEGGEMCWAVDDNDVDCRVDWRGLGRGLHHDDSLSPGRMCPVNNVPGKMNKTMQSRSRPAADMLVVRDRINWSKMDAALAWCHVSLKSRG